MHFAIHPNGEQIAFIIRLYNRNKLCIYDCKTKTVIDEVSLQSDYAPFKLMYTPDAKNLIVAIISMYYEIKLFVCKYNPLNLKEDLSNSNIKDTNIAYKNTNKNIFITKDSKILIFCIDNTNKIYFYNLENGNLIGIYQSTNILMKSYIFLENTNEIIYLYFDRWIKIKFSYDDNQNNEIEIECVLRKKFINNRKLMYSSEVDLIYNKDGNFFHCIGYDGDDHYYNNVSCWDCDTLELKSEIMLPSVRKLIGNISNTLIVLNSLFVITVYDFDENGKILGLDFNFVIKLPQTLGIINLYSSKIHNNNLVCLTMDKNTIKGIFKDYYLCSWLFKDISVKNAAKNK